jgi:hypothetical protein
MSAAVKKPRAKKADAPVTFEAYKGFDSNLACRGYQYEVGKTHIHAGHVEQCSSGFHVCQNPLDVLDFYPLIGDDGKLNRFAKVTIGGKVDRSDDKKWAAAELTISCELGLPALIADAIKFVKALAKSDDGVQAASGYNSQLAASGDSSKLAASGDSSKLAASGNYSKLAASGDGSKLAASGYSSKLAASGYNSQLAASGDGSVVSASSYNSTAIAGKDGAICLAYWDGNRPRFAIGYVGEDGIEAGVAYKADVATGKLVAA